MSTKEENNNLRIKTEKKSFIQLYETEEIMKNKCQPILVMYNYTHININMCPLLLDGKNNYKMNTINLNLLYL